MPHGLSVDAETNLWLTDVAMHQVKKSIGRNLFFEKTELLFKVFKYSNGQRVLTLGEEFVPGSDSKHFCKPTDVAVTNDGSNIYVADGYCNSRIVKFDSKGNFLREYLLPENVEPINIAHSILLIEQLELVCLADRENGR